MYIIVYHPPIVCLSAGEERERERELWYNLYHIRAVNLYSLAELCQDGGGVSSGVQYSVLGSLCAKGVCKGVRGGKTHTHWYSRVGLLGSVQQVSVKVYGVVKHAYWYSSVGLIGSVQQVCVNVYNEVGVVKPTHSYSSVLGSVYTTGACKGVQKAHNKNK